MFEEGRAGDATVVGAHDAGAGGGGELLGIAIPRRPAAGIRVHQHHDVGGLDRRIVGPEVKCVQPVHAQQSRMERQLVHVAVLHPTDGQVEAAVGDPRGLGMRWQHPGVHPQLRDAGRPLRPIGRAPVDVPETDRLRLAEIRSAPA
ncbi:hypothetical protein MSZK_59560 [Mycobacterium sp. shizuoka-1]|nr:hypothetical protein MSZK_59560 [Mycobacterium sp. shizuoka-1]